jgi:hypothetical protein
MKKSLAVFLGALFFETQALAGVPPLPPPAPAASVIPWNAPDGAARNASEDAAPTYQSGSGLFTPAAMPNDFWAIYGAQQSGPAIYVKKVVVSCLSTSGGALPIRLQWTNGANIATGTYTTLTTGAGYIEKHDYSDPTPNATIQYWTENPTSRNGVSSSRYLIDEQDMVCGVNGSNAGTPAVFDFTTTRTKTNVLKYGANYAIALNANGVTLPAGAQFRVDVIWQEQKLVNVGFIGDSTTAMATAGYLNGGSNYIGGFGKTGALNSFINAQNLGSNGYRLYDFLNNLNGVTWPVGMVLGSGTGNPSTTSALQTGSYFQNYDVLVLTHGVNDIRQGILGSGQAAAQNRLTSMIDTFLDAVTNGTVSGASYTSPFAASYTISSIAWASNIATITTSTPHQFNALESSGVGVQISGSSNTAFNGAWTLAGVIDSTHFTVNMTTDPGAFSGTAQEQFTTIWYGTFSAMPQCKVILYSPNSFTADDPATSSGGTGNYMLYSGSLQGLWSGMTLAQAAQAASNILFNAYLPFASDSRVFQLVHQQSAGGGPFPSTVTTLANNSLMMNQLHPGSYGQWLKQQQIAPVLSLAVQSTLTGRY